MVFQGFEVGGVHYNPDGWSPPDCATSSTLSLNVPFATFSFEAAVSSVCRHSALLDQIPFSTFSKPTPSATSTFSKPTLCLNKSTDISLSKQINQMDFRSSLDPAKKNWERFFSGFGVVYGTCPVRG